MEIMKFSRGKIVMFGSSALATLALSPSAAIGAALRRLRPNTSGLTVINYSDGVGLNDQYGNSILRMHVNASAQTISSVFGTHTWTIPANLSPGFTYTPVAGYTMSLPSEGYGKYQTSNTSGTVSTPAQTNSPINAYDSFQGSKTVAYTPQQWPGGGSGSGGPAPMDMACVDSVINFISAGIMLLAASASYVDGPELWGVDFWMMMSAWGYFVSSYGQMLQSCGG